MTLTRRYSILFNREDNTIRAVLTRMMLIALTMGRVITAMAQSQKSKDEKLSTIKRITQEEEKLWLSAKEYLCC